jgi:uncharacterized protein (TIGR02594 family)
MKAIKILATLALIGVAIYLQGEGSGGPIGNRKAQTPVEIAYNESLLERSHHGRITHERALEYVKAFPFRDNHPGELLGSDDQLADRAWCGFFLAWCLKQGGYHYPLDPLSLASWKAVSFKVDKPRKGDIAIMSGHVAFYWETQDSDGYPLLLGGNQQLLSEDPLGLFNDAPEAFIPTVCIMRTNPSKIIEYRRPIRVQ